MKVLLTFVGFHDPYSQGQERSGPILSLATSVKFDRVFLFSTPNTQEETTRTRQALRGLPSSPQVEIRRLNLINPTDYKAIVENLRQNLAQIKQDSPEEAEFFISPASGTPQMHVCWILMVLKEEFSATILVATDSRHVSGQAQPNVICVGFSQTDFLQSKDFLTSPTQPTSMQLDVETERRKLGIIGEHENFIKTIDRTGRFATTDNSILIMGETGTGKELFANLIHECSQRRTKELLPVNCASIPQDLFDSAFFGHLKGAFTGAIKDKIGFFQQAEGGTLFLDEFGDLPNTMQVKLLRAVEQKEVTRVGSTEPKKVNVRLIAATNRDIKEAIKDKSFRLDLYMRMDTKIHLPAVCERISDIPLLVEHFLDRYSIDSQPAKSFSPEALKWLAGQRWHGNVRELKNVVLEAMHLSNQESIIDLETLRQAYSFQALPVEDDSQVDIPELYEGFNMGEYIKKIRGALYEKALKKTGDNQKRASNLLGVKSQSVSKYVGKRK